MPEKKLQPKNKFIIAGAVAALLLLGGAGYFFFAPSSENSAQAALDTSLLSPEIKNFYSVSGGLNLDDAFMKGKNEDFFNELKNYSQSIPLKEPVGRPNPFVPYAAP